MLLSDQSSHPLTKHELRQRERDHDSKENAQAEREHNDKVPRAQFASHIRTLNRKAERKKRNCAEQARRSFNSDPKGIRTPVLSVRRICPEPG